MRGQRQAPVLHSPAPAAKRVTDTHVVSVTRRRKARMEGGEERKRSGSQPPSRRAQHPGASLSAPPSTSHPRGAGPLVFMGSRVQCLFERKHDTGIFEDQQTPEQRCRTERRQDRNHSLRAGSQSSSAGHLLRELLSLLNGQLSALKPQGLHGAPATWTGAWRSMDDTTWREPHSRPARWQHGRVHGAGEAARPHGPRVQRH